MKKITILLCINTFMFTYIKCMEMDIEENNRNNSNNTSESCSTAQTKSNNSTELEKRLKRHLASTNDTNVLLHTLILQNKTYFEYKDSVRHDTKIPIDRHAKNAQIEVDSIYKSANIKLKDKTLQIPMTGQTEIAKTTNDTKDII